MLPAVIPTAESGASNLSNDEAACFGKDEVAIDVDRDALRAVERHARGSHIVRSSSATTAACNGLKFIRHHRTDGSHDSMGLCTVGGGLSTVAM